MTFYMSIFVLRVSKITIFSRLVVSLISQTPSAIMFSDILKKHAHTRSIVRYGSTIAYIVFVSMKSHNTNRS